MEQVEHEHKLIFLETSTITINGKIIIIDKYCCNYVNCNKLYMIDKQTNKRIYLDDILGEEVE